MEPIRDLAIVLRSIPYEERSRIVTAVTEQNGLISAMARNAIQSRRFGGTLELFAASEWTFTEKPGSDLCRLEGAAIKRSYEGLRADFERLSYASAMSEVLLRVAQKHEPCPELFKLHANALAYLEEETGSASILLNAYLAKILQWSGSQPGMNACKGCSCALETLGEESVRCDVEDAAWICEACFRTAPQRNRAQSFDHRFLRASRLALSDFHLALSHPIRQIPAMAKASEEEHRELYRFLEALVVYHLPGFDRTPLKSLKFVGVASSLGQ